MHALTGAITPVRAGIHVYVLYTVQTIAAQSQLTSSVKRQPIDWQVVSAYMNDVITCLSLKQKSLLLSPISGKTEQVR